MSYPFFAYMSRLKYIARWGLMRSTIPENDAEHTLQTAMIAHALALIRQDIFHEWADPEHCAMLALYHDASEVFTGDLPTPVKYFTPGLHEKYEEIETEARKKLLATLPEELQESYASYLVTLEQDPLWPLAKAADTLSAFLKCAEEVRDGNPEFQEAYRTTRKKTRRPSYERSRLVSRSFRQELREDAGSTESESVRAAPCGRLFFVVAD